jgi:hypothetical protein
MFQGNARLDSLTYYGDGPPITIRRNTVKTAWVITGLEDDSAFVHTLDSLGNAQAMVKRLRTYDTVSNVAIHRLDKDEDTGETTFTPEPLEPKAEYLVEFANAAPGIAPWSPDALRQMNKGNWGPIDKLYVRNADGGFDLLTDEEKDELLK